MRGSTTTTPLRRAVPARCLTLLTVQEAANYASVSKQTVRRWIRAGDLRVLRAPRQIRIDESDFLAYLHRDADVGTSLSSGAVIPMSSEMQQAVADAMAATGGAEAMPMPWLPMAIRTRCASDEAVCAGHPDSLPAEAAFRPTGRREGGLASIDKSEQSHIANSAISAAYTSAQRKHCVFRARIACAGHPPGKSRALADHACARRHLRLPGTSQRAASGTSCQ